MDSSPDFLSNTDRQNLGIAIEFDGRRLSGWKRICEFRINGVRSFLVLRKLFIAGMSHTQDSVPARRSAIHRSRKVWAQPAPQRCLLSALWATALSQGVSFRVGCPLPESSAGAHSLVAIHHFSSTLACCLPQMSHVKRSIHAIECFLTLFGISIFIGN